MNELGEDITLYDVMSGQPTQETLVYTTGKNSRTLVPVSISGSLVPILSLFVHQEVRKIAGVPPSNMYIFPSTQSDDHVSGTNEIGDVCNTLELSSTLTATAIRHYVSSKFHDTQTLSESQKALYFKHFGHHEKINSTIYQANQCSEEKSIASKIRKVVRNDTEPNSMTESGSSSLLRDKTGTWSKNKIYNKEKTILSPIEEDQQFVDNHNEEIVTPVKPTQQCSPSTSWFPSSSTKKRVIKSKIKLFPVVSSSEGSESESDDTIKVVNKSKEKATNCKYKRWSASDNAKIKSAFKGCIQTTKFTKPTREHLRKFVRENSFNFMSSVNDDTPEKERKLMRKLYNEQKLYKEKIKSIR